MKIRTCKRCGVTSDVTKFHNTAHICNKCTHADRIKKFGLIGVREYNRKSKRKAFYGLPDEEFQALWDEQDGKCPICQRPLAETKDGCNVDHNHETNRVRGLLCGPCNRGLGQLGDDYMRLLRAADYLVMADAIIE